MHVSSVYQISSGCFRIIRYILGIITVTAICISLQVVTQFSRVIVTKMTCLSLDGKCVHITQLQPQLSWLIVPYIDVNKMHGCMHVTQLQSLFAAARHDARHLLLSLLWAGLCIGITHFVRSNGRVFTNRPRAHKSSRP